MNGNGNGRNGLHPTAEALYEFVVRYKTQHAGDSPSRREIQAALELPSVSMVHHHLVMLERAGKIRLGRAGQARMIGIPGAEWRVAREPMPVNDGSEQAV